MKNPPNVLFVIADQHNAKVMGCSGHPDVKTPNLDRLAADGVRFENAITQNPICTPSRVSFLSGQYCHNHGYYGLSGPNPRGLPNLLGHFRGEGYRTSAVGKIHCPEYWIEDNADNFHETTGCSVGGRSAAYAAFLREHGKEGLEDHGSLPEFGARGRQSMEGRPSPLPFEQSQEGWIAAETIRFMDEAIANQAPFFAHVSFPRPHQCTSPSEPFWSMYDDEVALHLPPNSDYEMVHKAPHFRKSAERWRRGDWTLFEPHTFEAGRRRKLHGYLGAISQVDHALGLLLAHLRERGVAENTIVVYASDHGDYATEHGIMEKAPGICADAITRIPFLWLWPGHFSAGTTVSELVEAVDLSSTVCALAGLPPLETSDGRDISHLLHGERGAVRSVAVTEFAWSKSVRKDQWRLVHYPREMFSDEYPDGFGELYNLEADPWEMQNLFFDPAHQDRVVELERDLTDWLITTTRPTTVLPARNWSSPQAVTRYHNTVNGDNRLPPDRVRQLRGGNYL